VQSSGGAAAQRFTSLVTLRRILAPVLLALAALTMPFAVPVLFPLGPDAAIPTDLEHVIPRAKRLIVIDLEDRPFVPVLPTEVRYAGLEHRASDNLLILRFELRPYPFFSSYWGWLGSRCRPPSSIEDPLGMSGGRVEAGDFANDPELRHYRSGALPLCP